MARGETLGVAIGSAGERAARRQRGPAVLGTEGIEIKRECGRRQKSAGNAQQRID